MTYESIKEQPKLFYGPKKFSNTLILVCPWDYNRVKTIPRAGYKSESLLSTHPVLRGIYFTRASKQNTG